MPSPFETSQPEFSRRDLLRFSAAGLLAGSATAWFPQLAAYATEGARSGAKHKSCILLYMTGGASHIDTFDPKPGNGEFHAIPTAVPGIQVCEHLPRLAKQMRDIAIIRSMSTSEGSHARAKYLIHTGYREGVGGVVHPTLGSVVSARLGEPQPEVTNFVRVSLGKYSNLGAGYLGPANAPLTVDDPTRGVENLKSDDSMPAFDRKAALLDGLDENFAERNKAPAAVAHREVYQSAVRLMHSPKVKAFDLTAESPALRAAYGTSRFAQACLLARRLVEVGVPFIEIDLDGWDTHKENFPRVKNLSAELDQGMAALLIDLKTKGLLDNTLVVWMGDFGRTPDIKGTGRGHWPRAWTTLLAGAGLKTGQVVGRTDRRGAAVEERPVSATDFLATICKALGIDYTQEFRTRSGRPMRIVMKGEKPIDELFA
ncbi:MAG TPA: DUF1501 domain-containing protein [Pirellulales bacterium]|nr:DUF1501 domain-containing protein [Pirellulales bacterium]